MQAFLKNHKSSKSDGQIPHTSSTETSSTERRKANAPWVEKYRPATVDDVVEQSEVVAVLRKCLDGADLPNLLLYGPPGTGKTSTILAAARQLYGDMFRSRILELNASDDRGINIVRTKIRTFAQLTASGVREDGKPCPPFKIIILDEADSMTNAAQAALRRTMEKESRSTRFCLICNYVSRIIEPIASRCTKFRFKPLSDERIVERLKHVCKSEGVTVENDAFETIIKTSGGDMRRAITSLQSCFLLKGQSGTVTEKDVIELSYLVPDKYLEEFLEVGRSGNYTNLEDFVRDFTYEAYSVGQYFEQFTEFIVFHPALTNRQKGIICEKLGLCCFRLKQGGSEYLQMMDLGMSLIAAFKET